MPQYGNVRFFLFGENAFLEIYNFGQFLLKSHAGKEVDNIYFAIALKPDAQLFPVAAWAGPGP